MRREDEDNFRKADILLEATYFLVFANLILMLAIIIFKL